MKRIAIAAVVGGLVFFIWSSIAHILLPLGEMGLSTMPNEAQVLETLKSSITEDGLYFYPGTDMSKEATPAEQAAWEAKIQSGPTGLLLYHPGGSEALSPRQLVSELLSNIVAAFVAAFIVSLIAAAYGRRVMVVTLLGFFGWISLLFSYWNWYGFPTAYVLGEGITEIVGWFLTGLVIAKIVPAAGTAS